LLTVGLEREGDDAGWRERVVMTTDSLSAPIKEFMRSCEVLLSAPISRETLTEEEIEIIKMYVESLRERFVD
jgi:hypothetical protein